MTAPFHVLTLPGDGIGPEVTAVANQILEEVARRGGLALETSQRAFGGASVDAHGVPATDETLADAQAADAVLLGAVGGPKYNDLPPVRRPEKGLLTLRAHLGVYANLRPARCFPALAHASPLRPELTKGVDVLFVRELIGGIYFGQPRALEGAPGQRVGSNTMVYSEPEIERIVRVAFRLAGGRGKHLTSVDKANVLEVHRLWRDVVNRIAPEYPDVTVEHMYVDNCAMQLATRPGRFDTVVTGNLFGDILSDEAAALTGSLGVLPSAALGDGTGLFEPVHGSAPDIAGQGVANPIAAVLSAAMLLRWSAQRDDLAQAIERAVDTVLDAGLRTPDLFTGRPGEHKVGTAEIGAALQDALEVAPQTSEGAA
jgi:3-isopropylmalate dehydrogenase